MRKSKLPLLFCFLFLSYALLGQDRSPNWAVPVTGLSLKNIYRIDSALYRSEQPDAKSFKELQEYGIKEVLNLRFWNSDEKEAEGTNLILHHVKLNAYNINDYDIIQALRIIKNKKGPLLFHCKHGSDRTGALNAMYRIVFQNVSKEDALDELVNGGYGFHSIFINIPSYIKKVDIEKIKSKVFEE